MRGRSFAGVLLGVLAAPGEAYVLEPPLNAAATDEGERKSTRGGQWLAAPRARGVNL